MWINKKIPICSFVKFLPCRTFPLCGPCYVVNIVYTSACRSSLLPSVKHKHVFVVISIQKKQICNNILRYNWIILFFLQKSQDILADIKSLSFYIRMRKNFQIMQVLTKWSATLLEHTDTITCYIISISIIEHVCSQNKYFISKLLDILYNITSKLENLLFWPSLRLSCETVTLITVFLLLTVKTPKTATVMQLLPYTV